MHGAPKSLLESVAGQELKKAMDEARKALTFREQRIIGLRFDDDKTLDETGKEVGLTRQRVRDIEAKALRKLRLRGEQLRSFAEEM